MNMNNMGGMGMGGQQPQQFNLQQFQARGQGPDTSWHAGQSQQMRDQIVSTLESQFPHLFKQFNIPIKFAPQNPRAFAQKAEEEAWKSSSSFEEYQRKCMNNLSVIARWHIGQLQKAQQQAQLQQLQQPQVQMNLGGDDPQQTQLQQMLLGQTGQSQQSQAPQQPQQSQNTQMHTQSQPQIGVLNPNQQSFNPNAFRGNFPLSGDTSGNLSMTMQNFVQSQQQVQQRAQMQQQQQQQQQQNPQAQTQAGQAQQPGMMRSQFNVGQTPQTQTNLQINPNNLYNVPQQNYAANLVAAQRQGGLANLNQPINPNMQMPQVQATPQQRTQTFPQLSENAVNAQQLRNPLQSAQQQHQPVTQQELQNMAENIANYRFLVNYAQTRANGGPAPNPPAHVKDLNDRAVSRLQVLRVTNPNVTDQVKQLMAQHTKILESKLMHKSNPQSVSDAMASQVVNPVQQSAANVQQHLQQAQAGKQQQQQQMNRLMNQQVQPDQMNQLSQSQLSIPQQIQNMRAQVAGVGRATAGQNFVGQQMNPQNQQPMGQQGQVTNPMQTSGLTASQQMQVMHQLQLQQQQRQGANLQVLASLGQNAGIPQTSPQQQQQQQQQQPQQSQQLQMQQLQQRTAGGDANPNAFNPTNFIPQESNPHRYPIPFDTQQRLIEIGVPAERLSSWSDAVNWCNDAQKRRIISDEVYAKVRSEYFKVAQAMGANPRAFIQQQMQARNTALGNNMQIQNQQHMLNQMQARQLQGQQVNPTQSLQSSPQTMPPQVPMNMGGMSQLPQHMAAQQQQQQQPQAPPLQAQPSQQQQQQQSQIQAAQAAAAARRARPPPKKTPQQKKGADPANPMIIGNTPTPTNIPTPSPAQVNATLPNATPLAMASPAAFHPSATPQHLGVSPAEMHTPSQAEQMQPNIQDTRAQDFQAAVAFVRLEMEKLRMQMTSQVQQQKNLTMEEKEQMKGLLKDPQVLSCLGQIEKLAPFLHLLLRNEQRTASFLRLRQMTLMVLEAASKDRHICTPDDWVKQYRPAILSQVSQVMALIQKLGPTRNPQNQAPPVNTPSPMVPNPAGIPISLGKHQLKQEDLRIPESKRRRSTAAGGSASPASATDPASVPPMSQTPVTMGTPTSYPMSTPVVSKRPSTDSPAGQVPPPKMQITSSGPVTQRDKAQDEALARRQAKEKAEQREREESRKNPLEYAVAMMNKAMGVQKPDNKSTTTELPPPKMQGLADKVRKSEAASEALKAGSEMPTPNGVKAMKNSPGQKAQLPSPPWSGTLTPRQLSETFANTVDIEFSLTRSYGREQRSNTEDPTVDLFGDSEQKEEAVVSEEINDDSGLDFLLPLDGELGFDEAYSWTRGLHIPFNGDMSNIFEQANQLGVVA